ncbi:MAG: hypothetical protein SFW09_20935 [Hyphomicrobiaceae bacterium]|nr:hypothetical protein [Hyphomicrobiaceae bacterium]
MTSSVELSYRRPRADERVRLQELLRQHWRADHIFVADSRWLDWQHLDADGKSFHAVIATTPDDRIVGFLGVMPYGRIGDDVLDLCTGIWIALKGEGGGRAGLGLFRALEQIYKPRFIGSLGVNPAASGVLRMIGHRSGSSQTYYVANPDMPDRLARQLDRGVPPELPASGEAWLDEVDSAAELAMFAAGRMPLKPAHWLAWRYGSGAPFTYRFLIAGREGGGAGVGIVMRVVEHGGARCLRISDVVGDIGSVGSLARSLVALCRREKAEYIDCLAGGPGGEVLAKAGFRAAADPVVVPNYFDPFEQRNVTLGWTIKAPAAGGLLFRGDGDQDRPNRPSLEAPRPRWQDQ